MGRLKKVRHIQMAPHFRGFEPIGNQHKKSAEIASISFEEYEAINLCDYELLSQEEAAKAMNVSRPTFTRIYESVRRKIAKAFVEGSEILFEEGNSNIANWHECKKCNITFTTTVSSGAYCPFCKTAINK